MTAKNYTRKVNVTPLQATIELAKRGRKELLPQLRQFLDEQPELWEYYGNVARQAQANWLKLIGGTNLYMQETMTRFAEAQRADLAGPDASPLERLMIQ